MILDYTNKRLHLDPQYVSEKLHNNNLINKNKLQMFPILHFVLIFEASRDIEDIKRKTVILNCNTNSQ